MASLSRRTTRLLRALAALLVALVPTPALAHQAGDVAGGLLAGLRHPFSGADHVLAMVAVGLWGAELGPPAIWLLPVTFPLVMAFGGALGVAGVPLPAPEVGIALSALTLGMMVATAAKPPLGVASALVAVFAVFHGHAHGVELPASTSPLAYSAGFVASTGGLHVIGIAIGATGRWPLGKWVVRVGGMAVAGGGAYFLVRALGF